MARDFPRTDADARRAVEHHRRAEAVGGRRACRACSTRAPAASRTSTGRSSGTCARVLARAPRLRSRRPRRDRDVGHVARDADVRPHDRAHARLLHHRRRRHARARRHRRDEHHAGRGARSGRARSACARRSARRPRSIQRQFFLEGFFLTMLSGALGLRASRSASARLVNLLPMPARFSGMVLSLAVRRCWRSPRSSSIGVVTSTYPARRAARAAAGRGAALRDVAMTPTATAPRRPARDVAARGRAARRRRARGVHRAVRNRFARPVDARHLVGHRLGRDAAGLRQRLPRRARRAASAARSATASSIAWPGQTSMQAGGERAGKRVRVTRGRRAGGRASCRS